MFGNRLTISNPRRLLFLLAGTACLVSLRNGQTFADDKPAVANKPMTIDKFLDQGSLADAEAEIKELIAADAGNESAKFGLGVVKVFQAVERLGQSQYKFGLTANRFASIPFLRLPVPENRDPAEISYEANRQMIATFVKDLGDAEKVLATVDSMQVKLPIDINHIRLDLIGDGKEANRKNLRDIINAAMPGMRLPKELPLEIAFDGGDVHWLRGYCHLLMFFGESMLAHSWQDTFERTAHMFYPKVKTPHAFLQDETPSKGRFSTHDVMDLIALVHTVNFPVVEPKRMEKALEHIEAVIEQSKESWNLIQAETDNDREWIPNVEQTSVIPNVAVTEEMIGSWHTFLDEFESIVQGKTLIPFWRGTARKPGFGAPDAHPTLGINFRKIFTNPQRFDLVLWIHGSGATPYLEEGKITDPAIWRDLQRVFRGQFWGFAIWFN